MASVVFVIVAPTGVSVHYLSECDVHLLTGTVKYFVRHLDEPLMTFKLYDNVVAAVKRSPEERLEQLRHILDLLPSKNREVLRILMIHLAKVASCSTRNNMTSSNLAIVFAPSLMRSQEESVAAIMNTKFSSTAVELMIDNCSTLFGSSLPSSTSAAPFSIEPVYSTPVVNNPVGVTEFLSAPSRSANTPVDKPARLNRDVVRRKPTAPPAPSYLPRPPPPTPSPVPGVSTSFPSNVSSDGSPSTDFHQHGQQPPPKTALPKPILETPHSNVLPRAVAIITPRMATEQGLTLSEPASEIK
ncbi:Rho GTPase-activating protein 26 [Fasciolopsis buskii]|uniref:Rho GTPase-activating protein 26 n=1 Tax=Fasciolopsis buskii TaxID=27845 RepID=A0A8E0RKU9_9TREM|nr:Rho GTPase-activating protein 26 [Fasciolopsis buski]